MHKCNTELVHSSEEQAFSAPGLRELKKQATRQSLVAAATRLFLTNGFAPTKIADITAAAGVAPRTFFLHFASKEDVLFHHVERFTDAAIDAIAGLGREATAWDGVQAALQSLVELFEAAGEGVDELAPLRVQVIREGRGVPPSLASRLSTLQARILDHLLARFPATAPEDLAAHLGAAVGAVSATAMYAVADGAKPGAESVRELMLHALERAGSGFADIT